MHYDLTVKVLGYDGKTIEKAGEKEGEVVEMTFLDVLRDLIPFSETSDTSEVKQAVYKLSQRIFANNLQLELSAEDVVFLKGRAEKFSPPLIMGRVCDFLNDPVSKK